MTNSNWTKEQWQAITAGGQDILVAAAAGSGKTAVLVERIINRLTAEDDPLDVDRLLVVTFTEAAAAEMRKRIGLALEGELAKNPESLSLKRQLTLINKANISTFHSFCLSVLRHYYYLIDLDPGFRVADGTEAELLREEVLEELFEEEYKECETGIPDAHEVSFYQLADCYASDRSDLNLQHLVQKLYDFARSNPWPEEWLHQMSRNYQLEPEMVIDDLPWARELLRETNAKLQEMAGQLAKGIVICQLPRGPVPYLDNFQDDLGQLNDLLSAGEYSWNNLHAKIQEVNFSRLKACRGDEFDEELKKKAQNIRDQVKKQLAKVIDNFFSRPSADYLEDMQKMAPVVARLAKLVVRFGKNYQQAKKERGLVDYADLEHYCLQILLDKEAAPGKPIPSQAALEYGQKFLEVLVDEYQDTNMVQEMILRLITTGEKKAHLFMVGDVKQSIYRFRLAEPELFLVKYKDFKGGKGATGLLIDLSRNFRSRQEVLAGTNFIFKQLMDEKVGEINYDQDAELVFGATDYPEANERPVELLIIDREDSQPEDNSGEYHQVEKEEEEGEALDFGSEELDQAGLEVVALEARLMAEKIRALVGHQEPFQVYDKKLAAWRPVQYRDIVILLRATKSWAPTILEEFKSQGIPAYAELATGYFEATEIAVMMSLLKVIDNPYQDIPLASVLRSPIVGLTGEELAEIRLQEGEGNYYEAVQAYLKLKEQERKGNIYFRLADFKEKLRLWRTKARQGALSDLIWEIYRQTGYYDFVGGMPGGNQRQANLKALYDRSRQYEATSFRGLFRFLRFIERLQEQGGDFGAARALGEQEDVVRVMTIHKSKGLEFPVVFVAGLGKQFNQQDLHKQFLLHKKLGFGTKMIDPIGRISFPTLPQLVIKERLRLELLAEEMRLLYVALTRAKEKLYLIGTVTALAQAREKWREQLSCATWLLPDYERSNCKTYLDWIGRALVRHRDGMPLRQPGAEVSIFPEVEKHHSRWQINIYQAGRLIKVEEEKKAREEKIIAAISACQPVAIASAACGQVGQRLNWQYPYHQAPLHLAKQTVTEIKRHWENNAAVENGPIINLQEAITERPRFLQELQLTQAEKGTIMHQVMQHLELNKLTPAEIAAQINHMVELEILTPEQRAVISVEQILKFFQSEIGQRLVASGRVEREIPFSLAQPAQTIYQDWIGEETAQVLVQGVIDCIFFEEDGLILLDYKTDSITGRYQNGFPGAVKVFTERYQIQLELYTRAIEEIWRQPVKEQYLYFFDGGYLLQLNKKRR